MSVEHGTHRDGQVELVIAFSLMEEGQKFCGRLVSLQLCKAFGVSIIREVERLGKNI